MDILFHNRYTRDKSVFKEFYMYAFFQRKLIICAHIILAIELIWSIVLIFRLHSLNKFSIIGIACVVVLVAYRIISYLSHVNVTSKRDLEMFGQPPEVEFKASEVSMCVSAMDEKPIEVKFDNIKKACCTKNLILLFTKAHFVHILKKDAFVVGDKEGFLELLKQNGIKIYGK